MERADKRIYYFPITKTICCTDYYGHIVYVRQPLGEYDQLDAAIEETIEKKVFGAVHSYDTIDKNNITPPLESKCRDFEMTLYPTDIVPDLYDAEHVKLEVIKVPLKFYFDDDILWNVFSDLDFSHEVTNQPEELEHWQTIINNQFVEIG